MHRYFYSYNITILYMFRALLCSSSGGLMVYVQFLVLPHGRSQSVTVPDAIHTRVSISRSTRATAAVIRLWRSWRSAGSGGTKTVSFTNPHKKKSYGVKYGDRGGHRINASSSFPVRIPRHKMTAHDYWTLYLLLLSPSGKSGQQCARAFP